ncbi:MAG TPA: SAM-dependent methyltransferase [Vicinamibacteria bacterium]|nr:SAM-dependent methyltransferase [Vicinamibacteria bacterium]
MIEGRPSRTAQHNALFRALEAAQPRPLFSDPWARRLLRGRYRLAGLLPARALARFIDRHWPGPRAAVCVRTRYIDDAVVDLVAEGLDQLVILGAGFDARAQRLPDLRQVRVYELDHPSTQAVKRAAVGRAGAPVRYVPIDFGRERLESVLDDAGVAPDARTLFLWEGVTNYLDEVSVDGTLRTIAARGTQAIVTYVDRALLDGAREFAGGRESLAHVRSLGEPFTFGLDPATLPTYLEARGLRLLEDHALSDVATRYYGDDCPPVSSYYHVVRARCRG